MYVRVFGREGASRIIRQEAESAVRLLLLATISTYIHGCSTSGEGLLRFDLYEAWFSCGPGSSTAGVVRE